MDSVDIVDLLDGLVGGIVRLVHGEVSWVRWMNEARSKVRLFEVVVVVDRREALRCSLVMMGVLAWREELEMVVAFVVLVEN